MNQFHFFPVRSAKAMCREQRGTVSVRLLNIFNAFNAFKAFPEPNRARRMCIPARFYGVLLAGMFGLVLTGCGGSGGSSGGVGDPASQNFPAVFNIRALAGEDHILVGWTNPAADNIDGLVITTRRDNASDGGTTEELNSTAADVAPLVRVIYNITGLTNDITYHITVAVRYENGIIVTSHPVSITTGARVGVGTDIDGDGEDDDNDNCPLVANADQANTDNADDGGDACDDDDDNDGVADTADAFRTDACASIDTDGDGAPDKLAAGCTTGVNTTLTEDPDDDNDDVADTADAFVTDACASTDTDNDGNPDRLSAGCTTGVNTTLTEDPDDDNDGVADTADTCPIGVTGWTSNASADHDRDGCRDTDEDPDDDNDGVNDFADDGVTPLDNCRLVRNPQQHNNDTDGEGDACDEDDDNDGVADADDAFRIDACASADTDEDGNPDSLVPGCTAGVNTTLTEDSDDDNDEVADTDDNCPLVANADQANTDNADDGGDACDDDDDNDGVEDIADTCPIGATGWTSNASADHDGDGCRDRDEDPDDDNDGVADTDDAFVTDACASLDTDGDGEPDELATGCRTDVNTTLIEDLDDDNDDVDDLADTCPRGVIGWTSNASADHDGDGCRDNDEDVDDNNNGLIEIHTLDDLARLRDDLNGDGTDDGRIPEITSVGSMGCPDPDDDDGGCLGYELTRSFNFSDDASYAAGSGNRAGWTTGSGWQPIGSCSALDVCTSYTGIFDGGGYRIADLFISASDTAYGVGLFGALTGGIQNLHLGNARVSGGTTTAVGSAVGGLVGHGEDADIRNASVSGGSVFGNVSEGVSGSIAGGLVGYGEDADIYNAFVSGVDVSGFVAGGLVGDGRYADIRNASVSGVDVSGAFFVGGLIGEGLNADIRNASVSGGSVAGSFVGGLVGFGEEQDIRYASVSGGNVIGSNAAGGLVGFGDEQDIRYTSVSGVDVSGSVAGGLVGSGINTDIRYAYVLGGSVSGDAESTSVGGLVGQGVGFQINYSYAAPGLVSGSDKAAVGGLIGFTDNDTDVIATYWDNQTTMQSMSAGNLGEGHSTTALQSPTDFTGIYADWGDFWCDPNTGEEMEDTTDDGPGASFIRAWDLGNSTQYPVLNCHPVSVAEQQQRQ